MKPHLIIGTADSPYLLRWRLIPENRFFNIFLHKTLRSDDERALHDHPWDNISIVLRGGYGEVLKGGLRVWRPPGSIIFRRAEEGHRLLIYNKPCWSLFVTGRRRRNWGFLCPGGWKPHQEMVEYRGGYSLPKGGC